MMKDEIYIGVKSLKIGCTQSPTLSWQGPHLSWKKWVGNQTIHWAIILTFPSISYLTFAVHVLSLGTFSGCPQLVMINDHGHSLRVKGGRRNIYYLFKFLQSESELSDYGIFHGQHIASFKIALRGGLVQHFMSYPFPIKWPEWPCLILAKWPSGQGGQFMFYPPPLQSGQDLAHCST